MKNLQVPVHHHVTPSSDATFCRSKYQLGVNMPKINQREEVKKWQKKKYNLWQK
jgi:hypothetical protein